MVRVSSYARWITTGVNVAVSCGWSVASQIFVRRQSPARFGLTVATTIMQQGVRLKFGTWVNKQQRRGRTKISKYMKLTFAKTFRWTTGKGMSTVANQTDIHAVITVNAGMKYKELAQKRLGAAKASFEAAAVELREAEREMQDAEKYVKSLRAQLNNKMSKPDMRCNCGIRDAVFVEHPKRRVEVQQSMEEVVPLCDTNEY